MPQVQADLLYKYIKDFFRTKIMFLYVAKSLLKGGRVALLLCEGVVGSSVPIGPGEITVLSNLQEGCVTRNPSTCLCERLKVALTSEAGLGGSVVV